jgi:hypothetical protein
VTDGQTDADRIASALERIADGLESITKTDAQSDPHRPFRQRTSDSKKRIAIQMAKQTGDIDAVADWCGVHPRTIKRWIEQTEKNNDPRRTSEISLQPSRSGSR